MEAQRSVDRAEPKVPLQIDADRAEMIARTERMTVDQRIELLERLSRDAAWIRGTSRRIR